MSADPIGVRDPLFEDKRGDLTVQREEAVLAGVDTPEHPLDIYPQPLSELQGLAKTAGAMVVDRIVQKRDRPDMATCLGSGKVTELGELAKAHGADVILFDNELQPAQLRNLEERTKTKVIDRTELILDIFATRAQTRQARLQVELAQLEYLRPRLKRMWTHLERQDGGIGTRGPGETQLETDRRLIDKKIRDLKGRLKVIQERKKREVEARHAELKVSLVGYTNAGKSTLMNHLTDAGVQAEDKLFATLDTRTRQWLIPGWGKLLLSDTVGFIRNLPHDLVESFRATLEEATHADLLLHVVDAANPAAVDQIEAVNGVLSEIGARDTPTVLVLNKVDRVHDPVVLAKLEQLHPASVCVSAETGEGVDKLRARVTDILAERFVLADVTVPSADGRLLAYFGQHGQVFDRRYDGENTVLRLRMARHLLDRVRGDVAALTEIPHDRVAAVVD